MSRSGHVLGLFEITVLWVERAAACGPSCVQCLLRTSPPGVSEAENKNSQPAAPRATGCADSSGPGRTLFSWRISFSVLKACLSAAARRPSRVPVTILDPLVIRLASLTRASDPPAPHVILTFVCAQLSGQKERREAANPARRISVCLIADSLTTARACTGVAPFRRNVNGTAAWPLEQAAHPPAWRRIPPITRRSAHSFERGAETEPDRPAA